jgi:hypothetical protein
MLTLNHIVYTVQPFCALQAERTALQKARAASEVRRKAELQCETDARSNCSGESGPASPTSISTAAADGEYTENSAGAVTPSNRMFESNGSCMSNSSSSHKNSGSAAALMKKKGSQRAVGQPLDLAKLEEIAALQQLQQELRRANSKAAVMGVKRSSVVSLASAAAILDRKNSTSSSSYGTVTSAASSGNRKRSDASNVSTGSRDSRANSTAGLRLDSVHMYTNTVVCGGCSTLS